MPQYVRSHGLGNDYVVIDPERLPVQLTPAVVRLLCDRHRGIGSDGLLAVAPAPPGADFAVRIFNPDGSEAEKSGNGIRIFAKYLREHGHASRDRFAIATPGGVVPVEVEREGDRVVRVRAAMGRASFDALASIVVGGRRLEVTSLSLGNPHCVVVVPSLDAVDVQVLGPLVERLPAFPRRTNVQFAEVVSRERVRAEIWERGAGYTLASGSSACAIVAACVRKDLTARDVVVAMPGGELEVSIGADGEIRMRGAVEEIATGDLSPDFLRRLREASQGEVSAIEARP